MMTGINKKRIKTRERNVDDEDDDFTSGDILPVYSTSRPVTSIKIYLDERITEPSKYRNLHYALDCASRDDLVEFHLNTPGGRIDTTLQICNSIATTQAEVVAICHGHIASAGTIIALECPNIEIMPDTTWMVHTPSYGGGGDIKTNRDRVKFETEYLTNLTKKIYKGFMTDEEITDMIENSREYLFDDKEIIRRLEIRNDLLNPPKEVPKVKKEPKKVVAK
jgi:ATP-dependent protease ClpP protease subunit